MQSYIDRCREINFNFGMWIYFYKVIYSERSLNPMAAKIVAEETDKNLLDDYLKWFCEENAV